MKHFDTKKLKQSIPHRDYYNAELSKAESNGNTCDLNLYLCCFHDDTKTPNLRTTDTGGYKCFACGEQGDILAFHQKKYNLSFFESCKALAERYSIDCIIDTPTTSRKLEISYTLPPDALEYLHSRGLTDETIKQFKLGYVKYGGKNGIAIPVGNYHKIKLYTSKEKGRDWRTHPAKSKPALFGSTDGQDVLLCAGEWDCMLLAQNGFDAVSGTCGEGSFLDIWVDAFKGKSVTICYDLDTPGEQGANRAAVKLAKVAKVIKIITLPPELGKGGDITDFFKKGYTADDLKKLIADTKAVDMEGFKEEKPSYWIENGGYYRFQVIKNTPIKTYLSNFIIDIQKEIEVFDGYEKKRVFQGQIKGHGYTREFTLEAKAFFNNNKLQEAVGDQAGTRAQFKPENIKHIRLASQQLSEVVQKTVLMQFGWNNDDTFLAPTVKITKEGVIENKEITVDLSGAENAKYLDLQILDDSKFKEVCRHILNDLLSIQDAEITYPLIGHTFTAPIMLFLNDTTRYALWVKGITGSGKSFCARLFQCFYGPFLDDSSITSWTSTTNFIQMVGFYFKDAVFLVDDFKKGNIRDKSDFTQKLQCYADGTGRGRLNADSTTKQTRPIRGLMIATGEDIPEHEASVLARTLILECKNSKKDISKGAECLKYREYYNGVMGRFIHWFLKKDIKNIVDAQARTNTQSFYEGIEGEQNDIRIARNLALNFTGFALFCDFMQSVGIIRDKEKSEMLDKSFSILLTVRNRQIQTVKNEQGSNIFLNTLTDLIGTGRVSIHNPHMTRWVGQNQEPVEPGDLRNMVGFEKGKGSSEPYVYINPTTAYSEVQKIISQSGGGLSFSKEAIGKQLFDDGFLHSVEEGRTTKQVKYKNLNYRVWIFKKKDLGIIYEGE